MSLVGDALRKARREAAEREAERRGMLFSAHISDRQSRSSLGLGLVLGAVIAIAATVAGGVAVWWVLDRRAEPGPAAAERADTPATVHVEPSETSDRQAVIDPATSDVPPVPRDDDEPVGPVGTTSDSAAATTADRATPVPTLPPPSQDTASTAAESSGAGSFIGVEDGEEVYILDADLGDVVLGLDFIVARTDDPFAEINGVELHIGGVIEGFRVKSIEHDRVRRAGVEELEELVTVPGGARTVAGGLPVVFRTSRTERRRRRCRNERFSSRDQEIADSRGGVPRSGPRPTR